MFVAEVAGSSVTGKGDAVGSLQPLAEALPAAATKDCTPILVAKPCLEEPYALIALVRVCGGFGKVTSRSYPERYAVHGARKNELRVAGYKLRVEKWDPEYPKSRIGQNGQAQSDKFVFICWEKRFQQMKNAQPSAHFLTQTSTEMQTLNGYSYDYG